MAEDQLYHDADLAQFYDLDNDCWPDREYCVALAQGSASVLDLGCGTGGLALRIAELHRCAVTGVDPAAAMLNIAASKPCGDRVRWVESDARVLDLGKSFDLIVMTGHAFQVFLTDADRAACLNTIARHLAPQGRVIFDSRNPALREWEGWGADVCLRHIDHPALGRVAAWNDVAWDEARQVVTYDTFYRLMSSDIVHHATSEIGFVGCSRLGQLIANAGLVVEQWLGDWHGTEYHAESPEIIPVGRLA
ncbi:MAG: class I SAM-dependent methyltransferase [Albidovulum sp.]